jgi:coenzyme F420-reducing hydrogenase alpha subunit
VHSLEESIEILQGFKDKGVDYSQEVVVGLNEKGTIPVKAGNGVGAVEVPRGILFHEYEIDNQGKIINANCIIPTGQNLNNIEHDMAALVPQIIDKSQEEITLLMEMLVRAYDPCISCSAHFLNVKFVGR